MRTAVFIFGCALSALGADDAMQAWQDSKAELCSAITAYVSHIGAEPDRRKWNAGMDERVAARDGGFGPIALDWFFDSRDKLRLLHNVQAVTAPADKALVKTACFYFLRFVAENEAPPAQVRNELTKANFDALIRWLKEHTR